MIHYILYVYLFISTSENPLITYNKVLLNFTLILNAVYLIK